MRFSSSLRSSPLWWALLGTALFCVSCNVGGGATLNPVTGKVMYQGKPAAGALVTLHPANADLKTLFPTGLVGSDGTFNVMTGSAKGAPTGDYTVTILWSVVDNPGGKKGAISTAMPETKDALGGRYSDAKSSQLKATVKSGTNELQPFDLK